VKGVLFEVHHTPPAHEHLVGQVVNLCWSDEPKVRAYIEQKTCTSAKRRVQPKTGYSPIV